MGQYLFKFNKKETETLFYNPVFVGGTKLIFRVIFKVHFHIKSQLLDPIEFPEVKSLLKVMKMLFTLS